MSSRAARIRIRTLAFGVIVDPNITQPLPFAGLSYVDFNLFGTGTQFSGFFGGSYGQLAFSAPSVRRHAVAAGRARVRHRLVVQRPRVRARTRAVHLDIRQRPAQAAVWVLRPLSARTALRLEYDWDYTKFGAGDVTDPAFVRAATTRTRTRCAPGWTSSARGWQASAWGSYARRIGWRPWGTAAGASLPKTPVRSGTRRLHALRREPAALPGAVSARDDED